jgi:hypothetical protein
MLIRYTPITGNYYGEMLVLHSECHLKPLKTTQKPLKLRTA